MFTLLSRLTSPSKSSVSVGSVVTEVVLVVTVVALVVTEDSVVLSVLVVGSVFSEGSVDEGLVTGMLYRSIGC